MAHRNTQLNFETNPDDLHELRADQDDEYQRCLMEDLERQWKKEQAILAKKMLEEEERIMRESWIEARDARNCRFSYSEPALNESEFCFKFVVDNHDKWKQRRFRAKDTILDVLEYVDSHPQVPIYHGTELWYVDKPISKNDAAMTLQEWFQVPSGKFVLHVKIIELAIQM